MARLWRPPGSGNSFAWLRHLIGDGGYAGEKLRTAPEQLGQWTIEIVRRSDRAVGFVVLPKRWIVERSFAWPGRSRRLSREVEATVSSSHAWLIIAHIRRVVRKIAQVAF
ncbi:hypothetical protein MSKU15_0459 [Komagataeibacter diospyri]|nr:hypothetical protein MSKU15_0459 [Komagataeibacter diospyri]